MPRRSRRATFIALSVLAVFVWAFIALERPGFSSPTQVDHDEIEQVDSKPQTSEALAAPTKPAIVSKQLVVATLAGDDTSWLFKRLTGWGTSIYVVDDERAPLTVPLNKGREGMVYLTYIIDHYDNLPDVMVFIHGRQFQWHNDDPNYDGGTMLSRLQIPYIQAQGYVNIRCVWLLGCPDEVHVRDPRPDHQSEVNFKEGFVELFPERAAKNDIPDIVGASCCAQFALTRNKVQELPRSEYERIRAWLKDTPLKDDISGRIMEYSWHMIFGQPPVHCPDARSCYCDVFGMCELENCVEDACEGMYILPKYSTQPDDWTPLPEYDGVDFHMEQEALVTVSRL